MLDAIAQYRLVRGDGYRKEGEILSLAHTDNRHHGGAVKALAQELYKNPHVPEWLKDKQLKTRDSKNHDAAMVKHKVRTPCVFCRWKFSKCFEEKRGRIERTERYMRSQWYYPPEQELEDAKLDLVTATEERVKSEEISEELRKDYADLNEQCARYFDKEDPTGKTG